ncbi:MAG: IclR family transcriptional regulator [Burkholderiales bacterium]|nr:IclR family transcriptional regulator [Burkholderiales bacterium]
MMRAVGRTMAVFESFSADRPSLTLQSIANRIGLPKSTTFRLVQSLHETGYLVRLENQEYCLSGRFLVLATLARTNLDIRRIARAVMEDAAHASGETVTLNAASGHERVCVAVVESAPLSNMPKPGEHLPLVDGASAKLLLAFLPRSDFKEAVNYALRVSGQRRSALLTELERVRQAGYAVTHGERVVGLSAVAAPVRDTIDDVKYCLSIAGPTARMRPRIGEHIRIATRAGEEVSRRLGARASNARRIEPSAALS